MNHVKRKESVSNGNIIGFCGERKVAEEYTELKGLGTEKTKD